MAGLAGAVPQVPVGNQLPAPRTFAPSREDVLSTLGFFFGDPAVPEKLKDYSEHHAMTFHFPGTRSQSAAPIIVLRGEAVVSSAIAI
tara:strand:- start:3166 stop:3426 length:261 start_codon:yes stop_codon:yes gene_type:complete